MAPVVGERNMSMEHSFVIMKRKTKFFGGINPSKATFSTVNFTVNILGLNSGLRDDKQSINCHSDDYFTSSVPQAPIFSVTPSMTQQPSSVVCLKNIFN